jgi:hypothetical protein
LPDVQHRMPTLRKAPKWAAPLPLRGMPEDLH